MWQKKKRVKTEWRHNWVLSLGYKKNLHENCERADTAGKVNENLQTKQSNKKKNAAKK
jgi:hypothetical protein